MTADVLGPAEAADRTVTERIAALPPGKRAELLHRLQQRRMTASGTGSDVWVQRYRPHPDAGLRLFCFAYAGGGASMFRSWAERLPSGVEVCAVQLPGRESRIGEPAYRRVGPLVADLAEAIEPYLDRPFAFFGHSMGALVAFEAARQLRRTSRPQPVRLSLAAFRAPQLPSPHIKIYHLPDEVFTVVLRSEGVPEAVLRNAELMRAMLPTLRADFELCDTYDHTPEPSLACPLSVFGGRDDVRVPPGDLDGWAVHGGSPTSTPTIFPGSHFFLHSAQDLLLATVAQDLVRDAKPVGDTDHA